jgi:hypothetical protein
VRRYNLRVPLYRGWLVVVACVAAGLAVGLVASGVLMRRAAA